MDPKTKNLLIFTLQAIAGIGGVAWACLNYLSSDPFAALGQFLLVVAAWRALLSMYRRLILPAKHPRSYGKWAVVTGCTDGIGKAYVDYLAAEGMNVLLISRTEAKLQEQMAELEVGPSAPLPYCLLRAL